jgi:hypothetical protein
MPLDEVGHAGTAVGLHRSSTASGLLGRVLGIVVGIGVTTLTSATWG